MHHVVPRLLGTPGSIRTPAPKLGQHNGEILKSLGLKGSEIKNLKEKGVVAGET
jgi:formyl-CoA transferase